MAKSRYKITGSRINGYKQYPETIVEAIKWNKKKKSLEEVLNALYPAELPGSEHVIVKVRGCDNNASASVDGGKVIVEAFDPVTGQNMPNMEIAISQADPDEYAVVEFDVRHGLHYCVHSEVEGLGASFRLAFTASLAQRSEVYLWNLSLGVHTFGWIAFNDGDDNYRVVPNLDDGGEWDKHEEESQEEASSIGAVLSTPSSSFSIADDWGPSEQLVWSKMNYGRNVPGLEEYFETAGHDYFAAQELAKADVSGALNTEKILAALSDAPAAQFAAQSDNYMMQRYLPAAGELSLVYQNKAAINSILDDQGIPQLDNNWYWSSSAFDRSNVCYFRMNDGHVTYRTKDRTGHVVAVSAFLYLY